MSEEGTPPPLLSQALRDRIPQLYATEHADDPIVQAKLFTPWVLTPTLSDPAAPTFSGSY